MRVENTIGVSTAMNRYEQERIVNAPALQSVCSELYQKVGVAQSDADTVAEMQVLMDLRGVHSHATRAVPGYVRGIINGNINPNPQLQRLEDNPASVLLDGDRGLGHLVGIRAMNIASPSTRYDRFRNNQWTRCEYRCLRCEEHFHRK